MEPIERGECVVRRRFELAVAAEQIAAEVSEGGPGSRMGNGEWGMGNFASM
ncbi:MAG: hypothetical protein HC769_34735 [Cyanobacteria bacterium CRU_2_1]|nr:hypothetical protein [Cyanobacteria bacterium CRU_2_1]